MQHRLAGMRARAVGVEVRDVLCAMRELVFPPELLMYLFNGQRIELCCQLGTDGKVRGSARFVQNPARARRSVYTVLRPSAAVVALPAVSLYCLKRRKVANAHLSTACAAASGSL